VARKKKGNEEDYLAAHKAAMRRAARQERLEALREGRRERAVTFTDRKREGRRKACRDKTLWD